MILRLMSHNQWKNDDNRPAWEEMGLDCSAKVRTEGFVRVFSDVKPDIVGCQETSFAMADLLVRGLAGEGMKYALLWGRDTPILYRPDLFELVDSDFSLYPDEFPGHEGCFNNNNTKSYTLGVFRVKENGRLFVFASTHLWWKSNDPRTDYYQAYSDEAREYQMMLVTKKIKEYSDKYSCPAVLVGDMNADYGSLAIRYALENGYLHAHDVATEFADETRGYHHCGPRGFDKAYNTSPFPTAIDHVLIKGEGIKILRFERFSPEYYLPLSDHSPVFVDAEI